MLMRCKFPMSNDSSEISGEREFFLPTTIDDSTFQSLDARSKRSPAIYLTNPAPSTIAKTRLRRLPNLPQDATREGIPFASCLRRSADLKATDCHCYQTRDNFRTIFNASPAILCIIQLNGLQCREQNKAYEQRTGYSRSEVVGKNSLKLGLWNNAEDRRRMLDKLLTNGHLRGHQRTFQTKTSTPLITLVSAEIIAFDGELCALVVAEDVTVRRQAEQARVDLSRRLINAQEAERTRVARELHDSIGQSLAVFSVELEQTRRAFTDLSTENDSKFARLRLRLEKLGLEIGSLSHQLHSPDLESRGLAMAIKELCRDFSERHQVETQCKCSGVPDHLSAGVSLCLFRVTQEALHNVAKHSRATHIDVEVRGTSKSLYLRISDDGVGFAPNTSEARLGLGLISMRERLHLIGGNFVITSEPGSGARVEATVRITKTSTPAASSYLDR
jgi:PAS domain S-box-containing protein